MGTQKRSIGVFTGDDFLYRKIFLDSCKNLTVTRNNKNADIVLVDTDTAHAPDCKHITMSRYGGADIDIPFRLGAIADIVISIDNTSPPLLLDSKERIAYLRGEVIKFTEVEFALLKHLYERRGEFAPRNELLLSVWGEGIDAGILNVYIHYIREKLESHGEKIIISSRKCGYKIDEKYFGGEADA